MRTLLIFLLVIGAGLLAVGSGTQHFSTDVAKDSGDVTQDTVEAEKSPAVKAAANTDSPETSEPPAALPETVPLTETTEVVASPDVLEDEAPLKVPPVESPEEVPEKVSKAESVPDLPASEVFTGSPMEFGKVSAGIPLEDEVSANEPGFSDRYSSEQVYSASNEAVSILHEIKRTHMR